MAPTKITKPLVRWAFRFSLYLSLTLALQWAGGAYQVDFHRHPDEAAHYVTGLMVRDYIARLAPAAPMEFAREYYLHYPKVAFGHWPPFFYMLLAAWTLLLPVSHGSVMVFMAVLTAATALLIHRCAAAAQTSALAAWMAGLLFVALPITQMQASMVMAEIPLTLVSLAALLAVVRFLEAETTPRALLAGLLISAAVLTKANGWALPLALVIALSFLGDWKRFVSARMWLCGAVVAVLCVPYYAFTLRMMRAGLEGRSLSWERSWGALAVYVSEIPAAMGIVCTLLFIVGVIAKFLLPLRAGRLTPFWAVMAGYLTAVIAFHLLVPTSAETRKISMALPAILLFVAASIPRAAYGSLAATLALGTFAVWTFHIPHRNPLLLREAALRIVSQAGANPAVVLVAGSAEGALIAEVASLDARRPTHYVLRASKQLASMTWNGLNYRLRFQTAAEIRAALEDIPVQYLMLESVPGQVELPHERLLHKLLEDYPNEWRKIYSATDDSGRETVRVFRRTRNLEGQPIRFKVDLEDKLGRTLKTGF